MCILNENDERFEFYEIHQSDKNEIQLWFEQWKCHLLIKYRRFYQNHQQQIMKIDSFWNDANEFFAFSFFHYIIIIWMTS